MGLNEVSMCGALRRPVWIHGPERAFPGRLRRYVHNGHIVAGLARSVATGAETAEGGAETRALRDLERQVESLTKETGILKRRVGHLYESWARERIDGDTLGRNTEHEVTPADFEWIRKTFGPKISKEEVVRSIRHDRDTR